MMRGSGRTTRMLEEAIQLFATGEVSDEMPILILGANHQHADTLKKYFHCLADVDPNLTIAVLFDSIQNTRLIGRDYREVFIDHYAYEMPEMAFWAKALWGRELEGPELRWER